MKAKLPALLFSLLTLIGSASAATETPFDAAFQQFQIAQRDDAGIEASVEQFTKLLAAEPGSPLLMAYTGAATTLRARAAMMPWKKMSHAEDGLAQIDKALQLLQPQHDQQLHRGTAVSLETRFIAANTFLSLPSMFNRAARGAKLLADVQASPMFAQAPAGFQNAVRERAAKLAKDAK
ncbi:hypothetical protein ABT392_11390 [Paucibacter sp. JuS9]|uniref:hypothetical protein n=1 Tax=Paucibacter sp. JuS9 TaxID=3228748 RepID=UPI003757DC29